MLDLAIARMQYEILNTSIPQIAQEITGDTSLVRAMEQTAKSTGWKQWWPETDLIIDEEADEDGEDSLTYQAETFTERTKKRMLVFQMVKDMLLAQRYAVLEKLLVDKAITMVENASLETGTEDIKKLSALYKDLVSKSITQTLASLQMSIGEGGLPTVIMRDLSAGS